MQQDAQGWQCGLGGGGGLLGAPGPRGPALTRAGLGFLAVATGTRRPPAGRAPDLSAVGSVPCFSTRHSQPRGAPFNLLSVSHFGSLIGGGVPAGPLSPRRAAPQPQAPRPQTEAQPPLPREKARVGGRLDVQLLRGALAGLLCPAGTAATRGRRGRGELWPSGVTGGGAWPVCGGRPGP